MPKYQTFRQKQNKEQRSTNHFLYMRHIIKRRWQIFSACQSLLIECEGVPDYRSHVQSWNLAPQSFVANDNANIKLWNWKFTILKDFAPKYKVETKLFYRKILISFSIYRYETVLWIIFLSFWRIKFEEMLALKSSHFIKIHFFL